MESLSNVDVFAWRLDVMLDVVVVVVVTEGLDDVVCVGENFS